VLNFYKNIDREKFRFDFYTYGPSKFDKEIEELGGKVFYYPNPLSPLKSIKALKEMLKKEDYLAVHAHLTTLSAVPLCAAKKCGIPYRICHSHSTTHRSEGLAYIVKSVLKRFSKIYPTHLAGCSMLSNRWLYGKKSAEKAFLLRNAIDFEKFSFNDEERKAQRSKLFLSESDKVIGHVGRFAFQKNVPFLLKSFKLLCEKRDDVHLVLVSDLGDEFKVRKEIAALNLEGKVHILPPRKDVEKYFTMFDIFALPSRYEGLPLVAVEAQVMGMPCLLSDEITFEANVSGKCEFLPIKSEKAWAQKLDEMLDNLYRYDEKELIREKGFDIKLESKRLEEYYLSLGAENE